MTTNIASINASKRSITSDETVSGLAYFRYFVSAIFKRVNELCLKYFAILPGRATLITD